MAIDKARRHFQKDGGRDAGGFIAIPWTILDSLEYVTLSHTAKTLLVDIARQYYFDKNEKCHTNGRLLANAKTLDRRGWNSRDTLTRAKNELIKVGFLFETVKGHRPNKASWYALTWFDLPKRAKYDFGIQFKRFRPRTDVALIPLKGQERSMTDPSSGTGHKIAIPYNGAVKPSLESIPIPSNGNLSRVLPSTAYKTDASASACINTK